MIDSRIATTKLYGIICHLSASLRLNILESKGDSGLFPIGSLKENGQGESNGHLTDDIICLIGDVITFKMLIAGIDNMNKSEVMWCTKTPQYNKVAREAFRKMFRELKPQTGQDGLQRVPKSSFTQSASELATTKTEMKLLMKAGTVCRFSLFCYNVLNILLSY